MHHSFMQCDRWQQKEKKKRNPQGQFGRTAQTTRRLMSESKQNMSRREREKRRQSQFHVNRRPLSVVHSKKRSTTRDATIDKPSQGCRQAKPLLTPRSKQNVDCRVAGAPHEDSSLLAVCWVSCYYSYTSHNHHAFLHTSLRVRESSSHFKTRLHEEDGASLPLGLHEPHCSNFRRRVQQPQGGGPEC